MSNSEKALKWLISGVWQLDKHYCDIANERIQKAMQDKAVTPC